MNVWISGDNMRRDEQHRANHEIAGREFQVMTSEKHLNFWDLAACVCLLTLTWHSAATKRAAKNINSPRWDELVFASNQSMRLEQRSAGALARRNACGEDALWNPCSTPVPGPA